MGSIQNQQFIELNREGKGMGVRFEILATNFLAGKTALAALVLLGISFGSFQAQAHNRTQAVALDFLENRPHIDQHGKVADIPLARALAYLDRHERNFKNKTYMAVVDFTLNSLKARFFLVNIRTGAVEAYGVAHGKGSDPRHSNNSRQFSNRFGSNATSIGFYRTGETYWGSHGWSLRLDGLSATNSNARARALVIHTANYVDVKAAPGRSNGCFALSSRATERVIKKLGNGALIYAYGGPGQGDR
jgi:hypothetical protein